MGWTGAAFRRSLHRAPWEFGDCADAGAVTPISVADTRASDNVWVRMGFLLIKETRRPAYSIFGTKNLEAGGPACVASTPERACDLRRNSRTACRSKVALA
jgi:hypothetical protein